MFPFEHKLPHDEKEAVDELDTKVESTSPSKSGAEERRSNRPFCYWTYVLDRTFSRAASNSSKVANPSKRS